MRSVTHTGHVWWVRQRPGRNHWRWNVTTSDGVVVAQGRDGGIVAADANMRAALADRTSTDPFLKCDEAADVAIGVTRDAVAVSMMVIEAADRLSFTWTVGLDDGTSVKVDDALHGGDR